MLNKELNESLQIPLNGFIDVAYYLSNLKSYPSILTKELSNDGCLTRLIEEVLMIPFILLHKFQQIVYQPYLYAFIRIKENTNECFLFRFNVILDNFEWKSLNLN